MRATGDDRKRAAIRVVAAAMGQGAAGDSSSAYFGFSAATSVHSENICRSRIALRLMVRRFRISFPARRLTPRARTPGGVGTDNEVSMLRHIAAGLGLSYEELARDFSKTNYSSHGPPCFVTWKHMMPGKRSSLTSLPNEVLIMA